MNKDDLLKSFDPNGIGLENGQFIGLPFEEEHSELIVFPVPWDVTVSYKAGTASGPENILQASTQLDLYDADFPDFWKKGIYFIKPNQQIKKKSEQARSLAEQHIKFLEQGGKTNSNHKHAELLDQINKACLSCKEYVYTETKSLLKKGKKVVLCGGSHATPLGYLEALSEIHNEFGILQIDAHMDLREAYEEFTFSHASIMYNALRSPNISQLTQVGIRDYCDAEQDFSSKQAERISVFHDATIKRSLFKGSSFDSIVENIINTLPEKVYVSFDIDGLLPDLCPNTGTPVPGGLGFQEATYLLVKLKESGKTIIGADLNEVAGLGHEWDGNVGARILYKLLGLISS